MRILTVKQPWAHAIVHFGKDVENRVRNLAGSYRGPVAIHAGLSWDSGWKENAGAPSLAARLWAADFPDVDFGAIIGVVDLVDVHKHDDRRQCHRDADVLGWVRYDGQDWIDHGLATCSPWADPDVHHLVLANPRPLPAPIPYKGALGLRALDPATVALIGKQVTA